MDVIQPIPSDPRFKDLTGHRFGLRVVLGYLGRRERAQMWLTACDCGSDPRAAYGGNLVSGSESCGCRWKSGRKRRQQGFTKHPCYGSWCSMWRRCTKPKCREFHRYGGRGITVCARWSSIENFIADMGPPPFPGAEVDRKNNNGGYEKDNCRWSSHQANVNNTSRNVFLEHDGIRLTVAQWASRLGLNYEVLRTRLLRGWSVAAALTEPLVTDNLTNTKVTPRSVRELRKLRDEGVSLASLSERFCITRATAWSIATRRTWRHID